MKHPMGISQIVLLMFIGFKAAHSASLQENERTVVKRHAELFPAIATEIDSGVLEKALDAFDVASSRGAHANTVTKLGT